MITRSGIHEEIAPSSRKALTCREGQNRRVDVWARDKQDLRHALMSTARGWQADSTLDTTENVSLLKAVQHGIATRVCVSQQQLSPLRGLSNTSVSREERS